MEHGGDVRNADIYLGEACLAFLFSYNRSGVRKEDHPFLQYTWFHWDEHLRSKTQEIETREQHFFRTQAPDTFSRLMTNYRHNLYWLPQEGKGRILDALDFPYFYPNVVEFFGSETKTTPHERSLFWSDRGSASVHTPGSDQERADPEVLHTVTDDSNIFLGNSDRESADETGQHLQKAVISRNYRYHQLILPSSEVRLLEILPGLSTETPITCRLRAFPIDEAPTFDAVSYNWGGYAVSRTALVDGEPMELPVHLAQILGNFRHRSETEDRHLWADAISINMSDLEERNHQVGILAKIFSSAWRVLISFGSAEPGDAEGVANILAAAKKIPRAYSAEQRAALQAYVLDPGNFIIQLFQKPYWSRIWIVQEIVLAKDLIILFGNHALSLEPLETCFSLFHSVEQTDIARDRFFYYSSHELQNVLAIVQTRREFRDLGRCDLFELLLRFRHHDARLPPDKIFGLLGLTASYGPAIFVDYGQSSKEMYSRTTMAIMRHDENLRVLSYHPARYKGTGLAEWPSWSMRPRVDDREPTSLFDGASHYEGVYNACGKFVKAKPSLESGLLSLDGVTVAKLVQKLAVPINDLASAANQNRFQLIDAAQMEFSIPPNEDGPSRTEIRWRTLLADQSQPGRRLHSFMLGDLVVPPNTLEQETNLINTWPGNLQMNHIRNRALFIAQGASSNMLLLGPANAEIGDVAVVLLGGSVPFVLRPY